ncbi:hypothetical protein HIM_00947 [Hirsutella minnesotensis 3608]|nr:hypothetical protein HIM_00947 [Hirsutella minnesotensis 3608]
MPLHITVVPASTPGAQKPFASCFHPNVNCWSAESIEQCPKPLRTSQTTPSLRLRRGDVGSGNLESSGFDAVFCIPPPTHDGTDQGEFAVKASRMSRRLCKATQASQSHRGRDLKVAVPEVIIIRPGFFHEIWASAFDSIKSGKPIIHSQFSPADYKVPMNAQGACFAESTLPSPYTFKMFRPRHHSSIDLRNALEEPTGEKFGLVYVGVDKLTGFFAHHLPAAYAEDYKEKTTSLLPRGIRTVDFERDERTIVGRIELVDALQAVSQKQYV